MERYLELGCVRQLSRELTERGTVSKVRISKQGIKSGGCQFSRGALYERWAHLIYLGKIRHKQERYPGQHEAIVPRELWEKSVQRRLRTNVVRGLRYPRPVRLPVCWRERSSMLTASRSMPKGRRRRDWRYLAPRLAQPG